MLNDTIVIPTEANHVQTEDRRSVRTKRLLGEAFAQLLEERGLDGFSVGDLAERADINRATFYSHYRDMNDLLHFFEEEIVASFLSLKPKIQSVGLAELLSFNLTGTPPRVTVEIFDQLRENGSLLRVLLSSKGDPVFQVRLRDRLCSDLVRSVLHRKYTTSPTPLTEYYVSYYASAMLGLIQHWLDRGMPESSEEMARIMLSIMMLKPGDPIELKGSESPEAASPKRPQKRTD
jgi:AcrR family transcriptional regulator